MRSAASQSACRLASRSGERVSGASAGLWVSDSAHASASRRHRSTDAGRPSRALRSASARRVWNVEVSVIFFKVTFSIVGIAKITHLVRFEAPWGGKFSKNLQSRADFVTLRRVSATRPAPPELRQVLIEATVGGCSGAMWLAYPFFVNIQKRRGRGPRRFFNQIISGGRYSGAPAHVGAPLCGGVSGIISQILSRLSSLCDGCRDR